MPKFRFNPKTSLISLLVMPWSSISKPLAITPVSLMASKLAKLPNTSALAGPVANAASVASDTNALVKGFMFRFPDRRFGAIDGAVVPTGAFVAHQTDGASSVVAPSVQWRDGCAKQSEFARFHTGCRHGC